MQEKTQAEIARQEIERMLIFGELDIKALYSENRLAALLKLGRTPVREALQTLEHEKMLKIHPRKGIEFLTITAEQQLELLEIRRYIEPICIEFAIMRGTPMQKKKMLALADRIILSAEEQDQTKMLYCLQEIHALLCEATQNQYFKHALSEIQFFSRRFWFENKSDTDEIKASKIHWNILKSVVHGDLKKAVSYSNALMQHLTEATYKKISIN